jgi:hypothetical protein
MAGFFEAGGFTMFPLLVLGFCLVGVAGLDALRPAARLRAAVVSLGVAMAAAGTLGFVWAVVATLRNAQEITNDSDRVATAMAGLAESANNLVLALVFLVLAALVNAVAVVRGRTLA